MATNEGAWTETCLIGINRYVAGGEASLQFASLTSSVDLKPGTRGIEQIVLLNGGNITKLTPEDISEITFEAYPLAAGTENAPTQTTAQGFDVLFSGGTWDTAQPIQTQTTYAAMTRDLFRVAILWTDLASATTAEQQIGTSNNAIRWVFAHVRLTDVTPSFTDGVLKYTVTFKVCPFNKNGIRNILTQSVDLLGTTAGTLATLSTYGSSNYLPTKATAYTW